MDMPLLDALSDAPDLLLPAEGKDGADPFLPPDALDGVPPADPYLFLSADPFLPDPPDPALTPDTSLSTDAGTTNPKSELVLHPFDTPAIPLANSVPHVPHHPVAVPSVAVSSNAPRPTSPLQENRSPSHNVSAGKTAAKQTAAAARKVAGKPKATVAKRQPSVPPKSFVKKEAPIVDETARQKDKLAQRKLRNKESARRYREKQVARRRQLENYTRTLTEQNRELEHLHDRLLTLTCERRMRGIPDPGVPPPPEAMRGNVI